MKQCSKCGEVKPLSEFNERPCRNGRLYPRPDCRECEYARHRESAKKWYQANRERKIAATLAAREAKNPKA